MNATRNSRLVVLVPAGAMAAIVGVLIATMLSLSALLGGASAASGCGTIAAADPGTVAGAPAELRPIFGAAAQRYGLGSQGASILAGLTSVESGFGKNMGPSSAGAIGWTQFMPATWVQYGVDADHDGTRDPYNATDAIFSAARLLHASGAPHDWYRALFAYNHADWYVHIVLDRAKQLAGLAPTLTAGGLESGAILVIGDSLEVGTFPELKRRLGGRVTGDFATGRPSTVGIVVLRRLIAGADYRAVLFDLGTNDADVRQLRTSLRELTQIVGGRRLFLATVNSPYDEQAKNVLLARYVRGHDNATLIPWRRASRDQRLPDGIHGAYAARARLIAGTLGASAAPVPACDAGEIAAAGVRRVDGGGRLVAIPGQGGELVDERILPDVLLLIRVYHLTVTAGYATSGHAAGGEHPLGLAIDVVPGPDASWDDVDRLAHWAEPTQNAPRPPFRWVGYDGDANHGRGNHLHLSWSHAAAPERRPPVAWVQVMRQEGRAA